jgi:hypothetical protein
MPIKIGGPDPHVRKVCGLENCRNVRREQSDPGFTTGLGGERGPQSSQPLGRTLLSSRRPDRDKPERLVASGSLRCLFNRQRSLGAVEPGGALLLRGDTACRLPRIVCRPRSPCGLARRRPLRRSRTVHRQSGEPAGSLSASRGSSEFPDVRDVGRSAPTIKSATTIG